MPMHYWILAKILMVNLYHQNNHEADVDKRVNHHWQYIRRRGKLDFPVLYNSQLI